MKPNLRSLPGISRAFDVAIVATFAALALAIQPRTANAAGEVLSLNPPTSEAVLGTAPSTTATIIPATSGVLVRFQVTAGPNVGRSAVALTNGAGQASFAYLGDGGTGVDTVFAHADLDFDGTLDAGEPFAFASRMWITAPVASALSVSPISSSGQAGTTHVLTASVAPAKAGTLVRLRVASGPNAGVATTSLTNSNGQVALSYAGSGGAGTDTILLFADVNTNSQVDAGEPVALATRTWTARSTPSTVVARARTACEGVRDYRHPSMRTLCRVLDRAPASARPAIAKAILARSARVIRIDLGDDGRGWIAKRDRD